MSRPDATGNRQVNEGDARYIAMLERDNEFLRDQVLVLVGESARQVAHDRALAGVEQLERDALVVAKI